MRLLANENFPREAVALLRVRGHDVLWGRTDMPGAADPAVLERAEAEGRILVTFDKDFGKLAYYSGLPLPCGIILFRISLPSPQHAAAKIAAAIEGRSDWVGNFGVVEDARVRLRPLPR
ncbi:MAG: DUF5615 family PIN-like protein [Planctomycetota bacterium]